MAINNKYTRDERIIVDNIRDIKYKKKYHRNRYLELDIKEGALKSQLKQSTKENPK